MISYQSKAEVFSHLIRIFQDELEWILNRQYTSQSHYKAVLDNIQALHSSNGQDFTHIIHQLTSSFQELSLSIGQRIKNLIDLSMQQVGHIRQKISEVDHQLQNLKDKTESLQQTRQVLSEKVANWQKQYDILKAQAMDMQTKYEIELRQNKQEKKQLKRTFLQVREETEEQRKLIENLQVQKFQINQKIQEQKKQKEVLLEEITILKRKIDSYEKTAKSTEGKVNYSSKKIAMLEEQIAQKNQIIQDYYESQRPQVKQLEGKDTQITTIGLNDKALKRISQIQSKKLADEMNFKLEQFQLQERKNRSLKNSFYSANSQQNHEEIKRINDSIIEQQQILEESRLIKREAIVPDIYLSHYLLTVQSIKLKINRQELFNIDMSQYYKQLISSTIPFHEWDDWIRVKLNQLSSQQR